MTSPALWDALVRSWVVRRHAREAAARASSLLCVGGRREFVDPVTLAAMREISEVVIFGTCRTLERERLVELLRRRVAGGP